MPNQNLTSVVALLKERWLPGVPAQFNKSTFLLDRLRRKAAVPVNGEYYVYALHSKRNEAVGSFADEAVMGDVGRQSYAQAILRRSHLWGGFGITGAAIDAGAKDGAVIDLINAELVGMTEGMQKNMNRQLYGDGTGEMARLTAIAGGGLSFTVAPVPASTATFGRVGPRYLREGMKIGVLGHTGANRGTIKNAASADTGVLSTTITDVNRTTNVVTIDVACAGTGSPGDMAVYMRGSFDQELFGISAIVSNANPPGANYGAIDRSAAGNTYWQSNVLSNGGVLRPTTVDLILQGIQLCNTYGSGKPTVGLCNSDLWRVLGQIASPNRNWVDNIQTFDLGWRYINFAGLPIVDDIDCLPNTLFLLDENTFELLIERELSSMDTDGNTLVRKGTGDSAYDAYEGRMLWRGQLGCNAPNRNCVIKDLRDTVTA